MNPMTEELISRVVPQNEAERLKALERYRITDTPPEESFNNIARIMAEVFEVPIALVSIVDRHRVYFKGNAGMPGVLSNSREVSLCSFAVLSPDPTIFEKPLEEPCLLENPMVHGEFGLRFYAGAPLVTPDGFNIGTVALVDKKERSFSPAQRELLQRFAGQVMHEIAMRQAMWKQKEIEQQLKAANEEMRFISDTMRLSQEQQIFLLQLSDRIRHISDPGAIQCEAVRALGERLGASRVGYAEDRGDGETMVVTCNYTADVPGIEGRWQYRQLGAELYEQLQQGNLVIHTDIAGDASLSTAEKRAHHAMQVRANIHLPLVRDGRLIALLFVHFRKPHACTADELLMLEEVAERTWWAVERSRAEKELERKVAERTQELEKLNGELRRTNNNLEEFAYAASHDLKEPIRKIHFFSDRLRSELTGRLDAAQTRLFERLELASRRMGNLIDDLLDYSQASRPVLLEEKVDLNDLVQNVLVDLELEIQQKGAQVQLDGLPVIRGHQRQLQQLFHNLLSNALKYGKPGVHPEIQIRHQQVSGQSAADHLPLEDREKVFHLMEVRDNGIGFQTEDAERIFNVFTRLHGNTEYRGTGVGLSIVRKVVSNHSGSIWAEGRPGEGASFYILLPLQAA